MLTITNEDIINILENFDEIYFEKPFNLAIETFRGVSLISVSGIIIDPNDSMAYTFVGQYEPTWGKYYDTDAEDEILNYTIDDVYLNKEDAQEMIQCIKTFNF